MRKNFVAGNWKMNLNSAQAEELAAGLKGNMSQITGDVDVAICPPFVYLQTVAAAISGSSIALGAQDVYFQANGAFTGEISVEMLKDIGCRYVIVGHSERRHVIGENDELISRKMRAVVDGGLLPILCIGELLEEREKGKTEQVIERQIRQGLVNIEKEQMANVTLAYEPVWAIGTGKTASPEQAQKAHSFARFILEGMFGNNVAAATRILYGGSVKPDNAQILMSQTDVDGALVGGASLKVDDFLAIIKAGVQ